MRFSKRVGIVASTKAIQSRSIDEDLGNGLWNLIHIGYWETVEYPYSDFHKTTENCSAKTLFRRIWHLHFKKPLDEMPPFGDHVIREIRKAYFAMTWNEVYDFIEFIADNGAPEAGIRFRQACNELLTREQSAYRFVSGQIVEITSTQEIESIEEAITGASRVIGVSDHLTQSLAHLSNRKQPDYRNSIKEAISAVECLACSVTERQGATLGDALKVLEQKNVIHSALKKSMTAMYGYTSDAEGIRHAMTEEPTLSYSDAKFMLVSCTAFINYVMGRMSEMGMSMQAPGA